VEIDSEKYLKTRSSLTCAVVRKEEVEETGYVAIGG
jgi:hypothetical protein